MFLSVPVTDIPTCFQPLPCPMCLENKVYTGGGTPLEKPNTGRVIELSGIFRFGLISPPPSQRPNVKSAFQDLLRAKQKNLFLPLTKFSWKVHLSQSKILSAPHHLLVMWPVIPWNRSFLLISNAHEKIRSPHGGQMRLNWSQFTVHMARQHYRCPALTKCTQNVHAMILNALRRTCVQSNRHRSKNINTRKKFASWKTRVIRTNIFSG